jgi:PAS domain S-box-containing protein
LPDDKRETEWLHNILEIVTDGIAVLQDNEIVDVNSVLSTMLGYEKDDLIFMPFEDLVDSLSRRHHKNMLDALADAEDVEPFSTRMRTKQGDLLHVEINPRIIDFDGDDAVLISVNNVTGQIALQETVLELENRFANLYDLSPIAYLTLNREGVIEQVNKAAEDLFGYTADKLIGANFSTLFLERTEEYDPAGDILTEVSRGRTVSALEVEMVRSDKRPIWASISSSSLTPGSEKPREIGLMAVDITRRKHAEDRLREERERADLYLGLMTSDLNIINQSALFALENLKVSLDLPEEELELVNETAWNIRRSSRMIANMEVLFKLARSPPDRVKTKVRTHFNRAATEVDRDFEWKDLEINTNIGEEQLEVLGDMFLWSIFFNILHNAMIYDPSKKVEVDVNASIVDMGREVRIEFADRGPGIPDERKPYVFKREGIAKIGPTGKGLGLTVVDRYVTDLGGRVWVEDRVPGDPSKGSKFVLVLPRWQEQLQIPPITFYKSQHCVFCDPVLDTLTSVLDDMGISRSTISVVDVEDPDAGISEDELPALPAIQLGGRRLAGYVPEQDMRNEIVKLMMMASQ